MACHRKPPSAGCNSAIAAESSAASGLVCWLINHGKNSHLTHPTLHVVEKCSVSVKGEESNGDVFFKTKGKNSLLVQHCCLGVCSLRSSFAGRILLSNLQHIPILNLCFKSSNQGFHLAVKSGMSCIATVFADNVRGDVLPLRTLPGLVGGGCTVLAPEFQNVTSSKFPIGVVIF